MASHEIEYGIITDSYDSYCDIIEIYVMFMHFWGNNGNMLAHIGSFEHFVSYLQGQNSNNLLKK